MKDSKNKEHIYFMGICGTGMAPTAGLLQELGYTITGSDAGAYPPMSTLLDELNIPVHSPYNPNNLEPKPDRIIIANALSRGHAELEHGLAQEIPYTSYPAILGEKILKEATSIVVTGTHGKTTTTSILAHLIDQLGGKPGFMIGGSPNNFDRGFRLPDHKNGFFVIEGDEYDTAFFDKNSKFHHYNPDFAIINNLEFDHADIFKNMDEIESEFSNFATILKNKQNIVVNMSDPGVKSWLNNKVDPETKDYACLVGTSPKDKNTDYQVQIEKLKANGKSWDIAIRVGSHNLKFQSNWGGSHNIANLAMACGILWRLQNENKLSWQPDQLIAAIKSFKGVKRRLDHLGTFNQIDIYEDFAHHPTAVGLVIENFKKSHPKKNLWVAFEPRNATSRRNIFTDRYITALGKADQVLIGACPVDKRIPEEKQMNTAIISKGIGTHAKDFENNLDLLKYASENLKQGDAIIFMSSGSFSGIQYEIKDRL